LDRERGGVERPRQALGGRVFGRAGRHFRAARLAHPQPGRACGRGDLGQLSVGSHYSSIQALEQYLPADKISLSFTEGMLFKRLDNLLEGKSKASTLFSGPYYLAEQLGYRKIIDTTFMIASMITGTPDDEDLKRFLRALKRAQRDIDLRPELYTHYYKNEFPVRYHGIMDTRRWGPGERIVFEPYTAEAFAQSRHWIAEREIFEGGKSSMGTDTYTDAVVRLT
jgi:hypothetical protein